MKSSLSDVYVRHACAEDAAALWKLLQSMDMFARMGEKPEEEIREGVTRHLEMALEGASHSVYVAAHAKGELVGYIAIHWLPYLFFSGPEGFVSELFVADSVRGMGIGTLLLETVEGEAIQRGCSRLQLINFRDRESYRRQFYEKNGWEERPDGASFVRRLK